MKAIKKPVQIEFVVLNKNSASIMECLKFIGQSVTLNSQMDRNKWDDYVDVIIRDGCLRLKTLESDGETQVASFDDVIIKGVRGECYPCKPDIFAETYDVIG